MGIFAMTIRHKKITGRDGPLFLTVVLLWNRPLFLWEDQALALRNFSMKSVRATQPS